jgi:hypothetical protein
MQIDTSVDETKSIGLASINNHFPVLAVKSLMATSVDDSDYLVGALPDGRIIQLVIAINQA